LIEAEASLAVPTSLYDWPVDASDAVEPLRHLARGGVDLVIGSANGTRRLDACELSLFARVAEGAHLTSIKGAVGEFGAAGAFSLAAACLALREQGVPPLPALRQAEAAPLRLAGNVGVAAAIERVLVCGLSRGGAVAALRLSRA
jgi:3-oxoacyl-(acyl-carrier-protein) synthase